MTNTQLMIQKSHLILSTFNIFSTTLDNITFNDYGDLQSGDDQFINILYNEFLEIMYHYVDTMYF